MWYEYSLTHSYCPFAHHLKARMLGKAIPAQMVRALSTFQSGTRGSPVSRVFATSRTAYIPTFSTTLPTCLPTSRGASASAGSLAVAFLVPHACARAQSLPNSTLFVCLQTDNTQLRPTFNGASTDSPRVVSGVAGSLRVFDVHDDVRVRVRSRNGHGQHFQQHFQHQQHHIHSFCLLQPQRRGPRRISPSPEDSRHPPPPQRAGIYTWLGGRCLCCRCEPFVGNLAAG